MRASAHCCARRFLALVLAAAVILCGASGARAEAIAVRDALGGRYQLRIFEQPDPAFPAGLRLRVNALDPAESLSHSAPLRLSNGMGRTWQLSNRSEELVPAGSPTAPPPGSAQFDLGALQPRPTAVEPLQLTLVTAAGNRSITLGGDATARLHDPGG
jgi:hypothetical protein